MREFAGKKLIAMDLDGTLTQHKSKPDRECLTALTELSKVYQLVMVCAGGCERVYRQLEGFPVDILGYYGMQFSKTESRELLIYENHSVEIDRETALALAGALRRQFGWENFDGETLEFHASGILTFPILGTDAALGKKLAYDPDRQKRRHRYAAVCEAFHDSSVFIGGTSSYDIAPPPYNKLYALDRYLWRKGMSRADVLYFGDDYGTGGNDADIYNSDIDFICIDDYRDFPETARRLLRWQQCILLQQTV